MSHASLETMWVFEAQNLGKKQGNNVAPCYGEKIVVV
jgi:hypothetical protein